MKKISINIKKHIPFFASILLFLALIICYFFIPEFKNFVTQIYEGFKNGDQKQIQDLVKGVGFWGPIIIIVIMVVQMFLFVVPSFLLMLAAVLIYGPWWGGLLAFGSVVVASSIGFWIGEFAHESFIDNVVGKSTKEKINHYMEEYGAWVIVIARINPFLSNDAVSFLAGLGNMGYVKFMLATCAGIIPLVVLLAVLGQNTDQVKNILLWTSVVGVVVFLVYFVYKKKFKKAN